MDNALHHVSYMYLTPGCRSVLGKFSVEFGSCRDSSNYCELPGADKFPDAMCGILFLVHQSSGVGQRNRVVEAVTISQERHETALLLNALICSINRRGPDSPVAPASAIVEKLFGVSEAVIIISECSVLHVRGDCVEPQPLNDAEFRASLSWNGEVFGFKTNIIGSDAEIAPLDLQVNDTCMLFSRLKNQLAKAQSDDACFDVVYSLLSSIEGPFAVVVRVRDFVYFGRDCFGRRSLLWSSFSQRKAGENALGEPFSSEYGESFFTLSSCAPQLNSDSCCIRMVMCDEVPHHGLFCMQFHETSAGQSNNLLQFRPWPTFIDYFDSPAKEVNFCTQDGEFSRSESGQTNYPENTGDESGRRSIVCRRKQVTESFWNAVNELERVMNNTLQLDMSYVASDSSNKPVALAEGFDADKLSEILRFLVYDTVNDVKVFDAALSVEFILHLVDDLDILLTDAVKRRCLDFHRRRNFNDASAVEAADVAVLFSGGLDSAILAVLLHRCLPINEPIALHNVAFCAASLSTSSEEEIACLCGKAPDRMTAENTYAILTELFPDRSWIFRRINVTREELECARAKHIAQLIYPKTTVLDDSIGCALWFAAGGGASKLSHASPLIVFSGLGADELFGGYSRHLSLASAGSWAELTAELAMDVCRIGSRNCGRDDRVVSDHGCELRLPFLDERLVKFALQKVPVRLKVLLSSEGKVIRGIGDKFLLRLYAYGHLGLRKLAREPKRAMQFGTRIAKLEHRSKHANEECERLVRAFNSNITNKSS